jgi:hypothetical protein
MQVLKMRLFGLLLLTGLCYALTATLYTLYAAACAAGDSLTTLFR